MIPSWREPMLEPSEEALVVLANYTEQGGGGWGPAAVPMITGMGPFIYTGPAMEEMTAYAIELAQMLTEKANIETAVIKYTNRTIVQTFKP